jgi:AraC family transcriptional regulator
MLYLGAYSVIGVRKFASKVDGANFTNIPQMWVDFPIDDLNRLRVLSDLEPSGVLGVCADMYDNGFDYWIAAATTKECPAGFEKLDIPATQWAVFEIEGAMPKAMQDGFVRIFNEWFPTSGYQHGNAPEIEWYSDGEMSSPDYRSAIWIPVVKTSELNV